MNKSTIIVLFSILFSILIGFLLVIYNYMSENKNTSSPVEEIIHRQLVTTLDSIFDARFGSGCCDDDDVINEDSLRLSLIQKYNLPDYRP